MGFIQIIEYRTSRFDEVEQAMDEFLAATEGKRISARANVCSDRDRPGTYVTIVEFPSYEDAMKNSNLPETSANAEKMAKLCDGPAIFRNLDVIRTGI